MYLSIIPFSHSIRTTPLTYVWGDIFSENDVIPWSIVEIPLGKGKEYGLVVGIEDTVPEEHIEVRAIDRIITKRAIIAHYQIGMILSLARRYMLPLHRVLGFFLPRPVINRLEKYGYESLISEDTSEMGHPGAVKNLIFFSNTSITPEVLTPYLTPKTIVICPDDFSLESYRSFFESDTTLFISSDTTDTRRAKAWIDIRNGKYEQIFWSRRLLYYNMAAYSHIIYLEDALGKEYFHYPSRIHYLDVLLALEKHGQFSLDLLTSVPLLSTLSRFKHFDLLTVS